VAVIGWLLDKSAASREDDPAIGVQLASLAGTLYVCPIGELDQPARPGITTRGAHCCTTVST
jgi:hypothetical protein